MRRFLWATPLLFVLISSAAWADSASFFLMPNYFGDNFGFEDRSGGMIVDVGGGTEIGFFDGFPDGYTPGSTLGGNTTVSLDFGNVRINGVDHDLDVTTGSLFMSSFTLPTTGAPYVTELVDLSFGVYALVPDTGQFVNVGGDQKGTITFEMGYTGLYYAYGEFTPAPAPEPGTFGLISTGVIGIFSVVRRRLRSSIRLGPTRIV